VALTLLLAVTVACAHTPQVPPATRTADIGEPFTLRPGESAAIAETPARITFERILSDNRCPVDVQCITAGEARGSFRLEAEPGRSEAFTLDTDRNATAVVAGYRLSLNSVSPAPRSTVTIDPKDYAVELTVALSRGARSHPR
jgi:hypothetical protein